MSCQDEIFFQKDIDLNQFLEAREKFIEMVIERSKNVEIESLHCFHCNEITEHTPEIAFFKLWKCSKCKTVRTPGITDISILSSLECKHD